MRKNRDMVDFRGTSQWRALKTAGLVNDVKFTSNKDHDGEIIVIASYGGEKMAKLSVDEDKAVEIVSRYYPNAVFKRSNGYSIVFGVS
jgi:hypothetical protein